MVIINVEEASNYTPSHQEPACGEQIIKADIFHFRENELPEGKTPIAINTMFESGTEPYFLITEEKEELTWEPESAAIKITLVGLLSSMISCDVEFFEKTEQDALEGMADYLEILVKLYRRQSKNLRGNYDSIHNTKRY